MNRETEDLIGEREAARNAIEHFAPMTTAWAFEAESASAKPLLDFYLGAVKTSDVFVLIIGERITAPVKDECQVACDHGKPILVFAKTVTAREPDAVALLRSMNVKYDPFANATELHQKLRRALGFNLLGRIRGDGNADMRPGDRLAYLRRCMQNGISIEVQPMVPAIEQDLFRVTEVDPSTVVLQKESSSQRVVTPVQRIQDVFSAGEGQSPTMVLDGRLQWLSVPSTWRFFPDKFPASDPQPIGWSRDVPNDFADFPPFANPGYTLFWVDPSHLTVHEAFFDDSGHHLTCGGRILACRKSGPQGR